ncbi:hypothetical protein BFR80_006390 [Acinetobacter pittii]|uniref:hypothetical protein n=1 Tax=Acinetobacter pittii TaxID=48296 RepID=UPI001D173801|nr:hypothetical protein [Acinetobacter pittii]MCK0923710.1 hypothetical protein [Acinetobacter pittii]
MEQNIMVSQISNNHRNLIKGLIRKQKVKRFAKALQNKFDQIIAVLKDAYKNSPALEFGTYFVGGIVVLVLTMSFALASARVAYMNMGPQQITIFSPIYTVDDLDLGPYNDCHVDCHASILTSDVRFRIEVNFDFSGYDDSNGFNRVTGIQIERLEPINVVDEEGVVNAYIDRFELVKINEALEESIETKLAKLGG